MEEKINEAQIEESKVEINNQTTEKKTEKKSWLSDFYIEALLFLALGILIGFAVKTEASKRITFGFDDYKMKTFQKGYDINELEQQQIQKRIEESNQMTQSGAQDVQAEQTTAPGGSCQ